MILSNICYSNINLINDIEDCNKDTIVDIEIKFGYIADQNNFLSTSQISHTFWRDLK